HRPGGRCRGGGDRGEGGGGGDGRGGGQGVTNDLSHVSSFSLHGVAGLSTRRDTDCVLQKALLRVGGSRTPEAEPLRSSTQDHPALPFSALNIPAGNAQIKSWSSPLSSHFSMRPLFIHDLAFDHLVLSPAHTGVHPLDNPFPVCRISCPGCRFRRSSRCRRRTRRPRRRRPRSSSSRSCRSACCAGPRRPGGGRGRRSASSPPCR